MKNKLQAILVLQASEGFRLVTRVEAAETENIYVHQEFASVFSGPGCVGRRCHMILQETAQPSVQPARRVALALREPLKDELQGMVNTALSRKSTHKQIG